MLYRGVATAFCFYVQRKIVEEIMDDDGEANYIEFLRSVCVASRCSARAVGLNEFVCKKLREKLLHVYLLRGYD